MRLGNGEPREKLEIVQSEFDGPPQRRSVM